jgi:rhodanese-related sulfurtransferase
MKTITPIELEKRRGEDPGLKLLDVRSPSEFSSLHVPGALNVPLSVLDPATLCASGVLKATEQVYLLCISGNRAELAAQKFATDGLPNVVIVEGGTKAWEKAGLPLRRGRAGLSLERQIRISAGSIVLAGLLLSRFVHPLFIGLSAFVGGGLIFAGITDWCGMGLLLAKAPWNQRVDG